MLRTTSQTNTHTARKRGWEKRERKTTRVEDTQGSLLIRPFAALSPLFLSSAHREIMPLVWKRIAESPQYWRIVYKVSQWVCFALRFSLVDRLSPSDRGQRLTPASPRHRYLR